MNFDRPQTRLPLLRRRHARGPVCAPLVLGAQSGLLFGAACSHLLPALHIQPEAFPVVGMAAFFRRGAFAVDRHRTGCRDDRERDAAAADAGRMFRCAAAADAPARCTDLRLPARAHAASGAANQADIRSQLEGGGRQVTLPSSLSGQARSSISSAGAGRFFRAGRSQLTHILSRYPHIEAVFVLLRAASLYRDRQIPSCSENWEMSRIESKGDQNA